MHEDGGGREGGTVDWKGDICTEVWMKRPRARLREFFRCLRTVGSATTTTLEYYPFVCTGTILVEPTVETVFH